MKLDRLIHTARLAAAKSGRARADCIRQNSLFDLVGKNVTFQPRRLPLYSELIRLHDNVAIARNVDFCTHDIMHGVFNRYRETSKMPPMPRLKERIGCIEVGENSFIGSNVVIIYGAKIGRNVVVASGSVVVGDLESDSVYAGVPARRVGKYQDLVDKYIQAQQSESMATVKVGQRLSEGEAALAWKLFELEHPTSSSL
ncbi:acyltransferase [Brevibacterium senegalense]|uniref:acyltransferase n=1 Tax=Brevibacterium senegalense TaxID=1033736 RepID=UPI000A031586|nr:DapH/DapD/GlmU-related protein [Brevibacterium senegalense]